MIGYVGVQKYLKNIVIFPKKCQDYEIFSIINPRKKLEKSRFHFSSSPHLMGGGYFGHPMKKFLFRDIAKKSEIFKSLAT